MWLTIGPLFNGDPCQRAMICKCPPTNHQTTHLLCMKPQITYLPDCFNPNWGIDRHSFKDLTLFFQHVKLCCGQGQEWWFQLSECAGLLSQVHLPTTAWHGQWKKECKTSQLSFLQKCSMIDWECLEDRLVGDHWRRETGCQWLTIEPPITNYT